MNNITLLNAVLSNNADIVKMHINLGVDPNIGCNGDLPLHIASKNGYTDIVKLLINADANINVIDGGLNDDSYKCAPLHYASKYGYPKIVKLLIKAGAYINIVNKFGETSLHYAVEHNNITIMKQLIKAGANVNSVSIYGYTPLHYAIEHNNTKNVKLLIKAGTNVNIIANEYNPSPINPVSGYTDFELFHINAINKRIRSPLQFAVDNVDNVDDVDNSTNVIIKLCLDAVMF